MMMMKGSPYIKPLIK